MYTELPKSVKGILYDMDGTITKPFIDWKGLRADIGVSGKATILEYITALEGEDKFKAEQKLISAELGAAEHSELNPGVIETIRAVAEMGIPQTLVTNNSAISAKSVCEKHALVLDHCVTREDGKAGPSVDLLYKASDKMGLENTDVIYIGDGAFDRGVANKGDIFFIHLKIRDIPFCAEQQVERFDKILGFLSEE